MLLAYILALFHHTDIQQAAFIFLWTWASLMLWCSFGWETYTSAAMGFPNGHSRLWGLATTTLRMLLIVPCIAGDALLSHHSLLPVILSFTLGLPYYLFGYLTPGTNTTRNAELTVGAIISAMIFLVLV